ncbi:hypothetical protein HC891_12750 [Candidatus Gracilibacteria bacterium]|nr:hypothetical protein [Candidatus Gracilibacteria bacterium]
MNWAKPCSTPLAFRALLTIARAFRSIWPAPAQFFKRSTLSATSQRSSV